MAKTTTYRHWPTRADLILDAIDACIDLPVAPDLGDLRTDLHALIEGCAKP